MVTIDEVPMPDPEGSEVDAYDPHDRYIDLSRVEELPPIMDKVGESKRRALNFYDELAGH